MEKLTKEIMKIISKNLMIDISDEEAQKIYFSIEKSIEEIDKIKSYDFDHIVPLDFPKINVDQEFREDVVEEFSHKDKLLDCAKEKIGNQIKV